jgi:hypothetical protein
MHICMLPDTFNPCWTIKGAKIVEVPVGYSSKMYQYVKPSGKILMFVNVHLALRAI